VSASAAPVRPTTSSPVVEAPKIELKALAAAVQPQVPKTTKTVHLERSDDGVWRMTFSDNVGIRDINRLVKKIRVEFLRIKRRRRMQASRDAKKAQTKGPVNVTIPTK